MLYGDADWRRLTAAIRAEDRAEAETYNATASPERRLADAAGPIPFMGAVMTAPIVLLLSHPPLDTLATAVDYMFARAGWPLAPLHQDAPLGLSDWWHDRLGALIAEFGEQHVANAVSALFLTPWPSEAFNAGLRLPSRRRALDLAAAAAARDAVILVLRNGELWMEHPALAALPATRRFYPKTWRTTRVSSENLGDAAWEVVRKRVEVHAWL
jgi:hypothetical protein